MFLLSSGLHIHLFIFHINKYVPVYIREEGSVLCLPIYVKKLVTSLRSTKSGLVLGFTNRWEMKSVYRISCLETSF